MYRSCGGLAVLPPPPRRAPSMLHLMLVQQIICLVLIGSEGAQACLIIVRAPSLIIVPLLVTCYKYYVLICTYARISNSIILCIILFTSSGTLVPSVDKPKIATANWSLEISH